MRDYVPDLDPELCLVELAAIFAAAILRLHNRSVLEISADTGAEPVDVPETIVLSVTHGG